MWDHIKEALVEGMRRVLLGVANFLPGLVILLLALVIAGFIAWGANGITRKLLQLIKFDQRMETMGFSSLAEWSANRSPTLFIAKVVSWVIVGFGLLVGMAGFAADLASKVVVQFFAYFPNIIIALVLLAIGNLLARFLARGVLIGAVNMQIQSAHLLSVVVKWLVLVITAAMVLDHLHIGGDIMKLAFCIVFGGAVLAVSLAVGLGWKEMITRIGAKPVPEPPTETSDTLHHL